MFMKSKFLGALLALLAVPALAATNGGGIGGATPPPGSGGSGGVASITAPVSPARGQVWLASSLSKVQAPISSVEHYPLGLGGQEQTVWIYNGKYYNTYTHPAANISIISCPTTADPTAAAIFYATVSGTTLTVIEPSNITSPDNAGFIQAGMTLQNGTGAVIQPFGTAGTTGQGGVGTYALSNSLTAVPNPTPMSANYWTVPVNIIGNGNGGVSGSAAHSFTYVEGTTLYNYFVATTTSGGFTAQHTYVATASISAPTVWTAQSTEVLGLQGASANGNVAVIKVGSTYYMTQEYLALNAFPVEGTTSSWQTGLFSSSTPTGTFSTVIAQLTSLRTSANAGVSHVRMYAEGTDIVTYYHGEQWGRTFPNDLFRATIAAANITQDRWAITNNRAPILRRKHQFEVDQAADPSLVTSPNGVNYLFYTAADNRSLNFQLMATPLFPVPYQYDGAYWKPATSGYDTLDWWNNNTVLWRETVSPCLNPPSSFFGAWTPTTSSAYLNGCALVSDGIQNDYVDYDFKGWTPGNYLLTLNYQTNASGGVISPTLEDGAGSFNYTLVTTANLLTFSNTFSNSAWNKLNVTAAATSAIQDSNGAQTAYLLTATATNADRMVNFNSNITAGNVYTASAELHAGTTNGYLAFVQAGVNSYAQFTLSGSGSSVVSGTGATATIKLLSNGWYKVSLTQAAVSSSSLNVAIGPQDNTGTSGGYPKCTSGLTVYAAKAQLEFSSTVSGYAPTTSLTIDTYSATPANGVYTTTFSILGTEQYRRKLRLKMATKNGSSSAYGLSLTGISLQNLTNGQGSTLPVAPAAPATATPTAGTNVTSCTCASATCTNQRGTLTIVGGTATTGTICSLAWAATPAAYVFNATMNGGATSFGIGNDVATTTGVNITAGVSVAAATLTVNYSAQP